MCPNKPPSSVDLAAFVDRKHPLRWSLSAGESNSILSQS